MRADRLTLYFDGGCRPNPGPIEIAVVTCGEAQVRRDVGVGDNSVAEWLAVLWAIEIGCARGAADMLLIGDSAAVVDQALGRSRCRSAALRPYLAAFRAALADGPRVHLRQVPRSKNLAGIALDRRYREPGAVGRG